MTKKPTRQSKTMRRFSTLAGPIQRLPSRSKGPFRVAFKDVISYDSFVYQYWTRFVAYGALLCVLGFTVVLLQPAHWIVFQQPNAPTTNASWVMLVCIILLQLFTIIGTFSATRSTIKARDPVPVRPQKGLRVAFVTTRAPGEPVEMVRTTLVAAKRVAYKGGKVDIWLLDETNDSELKAVCRSLRVKYFSRAGVAEWNQVKPPSMHMRRAVSRALHIITLGKKPVLAKLPHDPFLAGRSKHGNFNSWRIHLAKKKISYDLLAGVDTDQVPEPNYLERLLGYFRDQDVAYVVGPQVYGNYGPGLKGLVSRWAESQASFFQSTIQRAGNASHSPMFVGTNYAVRFSALDQIGGFQPCITEDMATGLAIHTQRNPDTGKRWKSVYTPDVLAVGEGPDFWGPYFTQQWRWAAGTFDTWRRVVWRKFYKLSPGAMLHYFLMLTYYPMTALTWLLGIVSSMTYLLTGATAIISPWAQFVSLYLMSMVMQLSLYIWNRRYNVSPHEPEGSYGVAGMAISTLTAPVYLSALIGISIGKKVHFVVTTKGGSENPDWFPAFRIHLQWVVVLLLGLAIGFIQGHTHPAMLIWVASQLIVCVTPFALGMANAVPGRLRKEAPSEVLMIGETENV